MSRLGLYIIGFLLLEVVSIVTLSLVVGEKFTLAVIISCFFLGVFMFKRQGDNLKNMLNNIRLGRGLDQNWYQRIGPVRYSLVALLFISPGIFSDLIAVFLLLSTNNQSINKRKYSCLFSKTKHYQPHQPEPQIIEGEFRELDKRKKEE